MENVCGNLDHKSASSKLWRTIKTLDGKSTQTAENEAITFNGSQISSPKQIANRFNEQFTTSKLGRHNSSQETRLVSREVRRNPKETKVTFTTDLVTRAIRSCSNTKAFGPDKLSIFHLKHLRPRATAYLTALFNDSVHSSRIPAIWKSSIVIPIPKPGKDTSQGTSYQPISLICPAAKVLEALILLTVNAHLLPADDQHGFRPGHSTTSGLLQLTTNIATGSNQKKPPHQTVCVAVDLTAAFDTVSHNVLISKISRSTLPEVTCRWLSCYLRGRQAVTSCRGVKPSAGIVHTGVPQGSKLSPSLFSFYLADMPRPTYPVKRICYADDISVWASGAKLPELEIKDQRLPGKDVRVLEVKFSADISPIVNSYFFHPRDKASFQRALHTSGNKSQQQKQHLEGLGRHYLGTTEGDDTDDLQGNRKVGRKLRCPSLEYQCKRHQHRKDSNCAERSPENSHRIPQDVKHRSSPR